MQPAVPAEPSNAPAADDPTRGLYAEPARRRRRCPRRRWPTIGDLLAAKSVAWTWYYAGGWNAPASANRTKVYDPATGGLPGASPAAELLRRAWIRKTHADERAAHLKDYDRPRGRRRRRQAARCAVLQADRREQRACAGYASVAQGEAHIADVIARLQASPQWKNMLVVVSYDENGGFWDHVGAAEGRPRRPGHPHPRADRPPFVWGARWTTRSTTPARSRAS